MTPHRCITRARPPVPAGFSLIEVVISMAIVSVLFIAAMDTVATSKKHQLSSNDSRRGQLLAQALMSEVMQQAYVDADAGGSVIGTELTEMTDTRSRFDDVDDYHNWSASPPQRKDGNQIPNLTGWKRSISVTWANPVNLNKASLFESGIKLIVITVTHNNLPVAELKALRAQASDAS